MKYLFLWLALNLIIFAGFGQKPQKPRLIVGIVIEQMRYDFLTRYWDKFSETGFKRLMRQGIVFHNASYDYLNLNSVSSLANLATGTHPYLHGIIGKQWYDRYNGRLVNCAEDRETFIVGRKGVSYAGSPHKVLAQSFSDALSLQTLGAAKIVVIAPTMEQAIVSGGQLADEVYWFDQETGKWVSSSYYFKSTLELPRWVKIFNRRQFPKIYLKNVWNPSLPLSEYSASLPDQSLGEKGLAGQTTFPYDLKQLSHKVQDKNWLFMHTPFFNTFIKDFAISSMVYDGVGRDDVTDYLLIVFPATAYVSEVFGIRSVETQDAYLKLDKDIAHLLEALDDIVGKDKYLLFLTADRGACDNPSFLQNLGFKIDYFSPKATQLVLDSYLRAVYEQSGLVEKIIDRQVYLNQQMLDRMRLDALQVQRVAASFFSQFKAVKCALPTQLLLNNSFSSDLMYLAYHSYHPKRSGDLLFCLNPNVYIEDEEHNLESYSECACWCNAQAHLPLIFYGFGLKHKEVYRHVDITSVAPTLSLLLGLQLPQYATAPALKEILSQIQH